MMAHAKLEETSWNDVRERIAELDQELSDVIDTINPDKTFKLYKINYAFGAEVLKRGEFYIPNKKNELVPITDPSIDNSLRHNLLYNFNSNPVCIPIKNNAEIYLELDDMVVPYQKLQPGGILGTWGILDELFGKQHSFHPISLWNMSAGVRSLFMLPKIGDQTFHKKLLSEYNIKTTAPKQFSEQWHIFRQIASSHKHENEPWEFELICFSKKWFEMKHDASWQRLYNLLLHRSWKNTAYLRNQSFWNLIFSIIRKEQKLPPSSYINDMVKHLHSIACGQALGFAPSICEQDAPIKILQDAYVNGAYKLKDYLPIIMTPHRFDGSRPVYFSLNNITALEFSEKRTKRPSLIQDITDLNDVLIAYMKGVRSSAFDLSSTDYYQMLSKTQFDCFHDREKSINGIRPTRYIYEEDPTFKEVLIKSDNHEFPQRGNFIKTCVRLSIDE